MVDNKSNRSPSSDEIDLGQLFKLIGKGFNSLFKRVLRFFIYLKRNAFILGGLIIIGIVTAVVVNNLRPKELKIETIVKPNFESKDYLYDVIDEVQSNIISRDTSFFYEIGVEVADIKDMRLEINPIGGDDDDDDLENDIKYLQVLKDFKDDFFVQDILKLEILQKSAVNHRITFTYKNSKSGRDNVEKIMAYVNDNSYFAELKNVYLENAKTKIIENKGLIDQIDELISGFTKKLSQDSEGFAEGTLVLDNEKGLDIPTLLALKNGLLKEIERKNLEIHQQSEAIRIVNFGNGRIKDRSFFTERIVKFPLLLVGLFLLYSLFTYLNRASIKYGNSK